jgi:hypothetical protein
LRKIKKKKVAQKKKNSTSPLKKQKTMTNGKLKMPHQNLNRSKHFLTKTTFPQSKHKNSSITSLAMAGW